MTDTTNTWRLDLLPSDVLTLIFDFCHTFDLVRLSEVCTRFYEMMHSESLWNRRSKLPISTNQTSRRFCQRCNYLLDQRMKWHVSYNWEYGKYQKKVLYSQRIKMIPWIQLTDEALWWSSGDRLCGFRRGTLNTTTARIFSEDNIRSDVCKFVVREQHIITGHRDGSIKFWSKSNLRNNHLLFSMERTHTRDVNAVDEISGIVTSGSGDGSVKIWNPLDYTIPDAPLATMNVRDKVLSIMIDPINSKFAVGSSGINEPGLHIYDIEYYTISDPMKHVWRRGAGILDMVWENSHTLLTSGYDTYIRKWDLRTGTCVNSWPDPTDATVYCLSTDYNHTMITGTQFNCKAVLWDQRQTEYIQLYFMKLRRISSPVYSIGFDSSHLYGATDQFLIELNFSGYNNKQSNYRGILQYEWT